MIMKFINWYRAIRSLRSITIGRVIVGRLRNLDINTSFDSMNLISLDRMVKYTFGFSGKIFSYGLFVYYSKKEIEDLTNSVTMDDLVPEFLDTPDGDYSRSTSHLPKLGIGRASDRLRLDLQKQMMYPTTKEAE